MPVELNRDLIELVVDVLADDKPTLFACALTSSLFRWRVLHHLFSNVSLSKLDRATALADLLDANPALSTIVVRLNVSAEEDEKSPWAFASGRAGLCALLPRFAHITTLHLSGLHFASFERECGAGALAAALPVSLRELSFSKCAFASDAGLLALVSATPDLQSLRVYLCTWFPLPTAPEDATYEPAVKLRQLEVVSSWGWTEFGRPWLWAVCDARRLTSLKMTVCRHLITDIPFWQARIDEAGSAMSEVVIIHYHSKCMTLVLSPLTMLRTLVVVSDQLPNNEAPDLWAPLLRALRTVSSRSLERAVLYPDYPTTNRVLACDWRKLRAICVAARARSPLLRVVLGLDSQPDGETDECERIASEAIVAHGMEDMVSVERMQID